LLQRKGNRISRIAKRQDRLRRQDKFHLARAVFSVKKRTGGFAYIDFFLGEATLFFLSTKRKQSHAKIILPAQPILPLRDPAYPVLLTLPSNTLG